MVITEIENLSESEVQKMAEEKVVVKGFNIYLVNLGEYFGYSAMVFKDNHQIKYANDYQLHHPAKSKGELKDLYLRVLSCRLFTDEEILEPLKSDEDYRRKKDFLINLYALQSDYISFFGYFKTDEERQKVLDKVKGMYTNQVGMCWMYDKAFVEKHEKLWNALCEKHEHAMKSFEYCKSVFLYEMFNHEYGINWQADYDVLNCFCDVAYKDEGTLEYLERTDFSDMQKKAYLAARREYFEHSKD